MNRFDPLNHLFWVIVVGVAAMTVGLTLWFVAQDDGRPVGPAVGRTCYAGDDFLAVTHLRVDGTAVDVSCGDRFIVEQGACWVQRGDEYAEVPCKRD